MACARILWPLGVAAALAACSGNIGGGQSTLPGAPPSGGPNNVQGFGAPAPTASPVSASNVATIGDTVGPQALPEVMGWSGTIAFPKPSAAPSPTPNPKGSPAAAGSPAGPVSIGITAAVVAPSDAPKLGSGDGKGKHGGPAGLFYVSLLSTADVTLGAYPTIVVNVPRTVAAKYHDWGFGLALFDPQTKSKTYALGVAARDESSPPPGAAPAVPPSPTAPASATPSGAFVAGALTPPPIESGIGASSLPPERVAFLAPNAVLTLKADAPAVFAVYAMPTPSPSASPSNAPAAAPGSPAASPIAAPSPSPSPTP